MNKKFTALFFLTSLMVAGTAAAMEKRPFDRFSFGRLLDSPVGNSDFLPLEEEVPSQQRPERNLNRRPTILRPVASTGRKSQLRTEVIDHSGDNPFGQGRRQNFPSMGRLSDGPGDGQYDHLDPRNNPFINDGTRQEEDSEDPIFGDDDEQEGEFTPEEGFDSHQGGSYE